MVLVLSSSTDSTSTDCLSYHEENISQIQTVGARENHGGREAGLDCNSHSDGQSSMCITPLNPLEVPLLNTSVLLASGVTITWAHHSLIENNRKQIIQALLTTILLGIYFTLLQTSEYYEAPFTISDGIYGSTFFVATGFHGLHLPNVHDS
ncbi:hypothetical protein H8959_020753 [Pygathrix nigripes]